jgi:hypothetical protein
VDDKLETALQALKAAPPDAALDQLEPRVWRRIERRREEGLFAAPLPARALALVGSLALGVLAGGAAAGQAEPAKQEVGVFSVQAHLAPSTLLEGR